MVNDLIPIEKEYARCITVLKHTGVLLSLPGSESNGVIGTDGREYPLPTEEQVLDLFIHNRELVERKVPQGFDHLQITPMAMPISDLIDLLRAAILSRASYGDIYRTRHSSAEPPIPVRVDAIKAVWMWDVLRQAIDSDELVYFPQEYSGGHRGQTKVEAANDGHICAIPGWSVGLVENMPVMPQQGQGQTLGGRRQLEVGFSPRDYLRMLKTKAYEGETGKTIEDFVMGFLTRLEMTNEVSNDRYDNNSSWLLGQYAEYVDRVKSDLVPTGWWHRDYGRVRLDAHRPGNRICTRSWGGPTVVRLVRP